MKEITVRNKNEDGLCMNRKSILNVENISENGIEKIVNGDKNGVEDFVYQQRAKVKVKFIRGHNEHAIQNFPTV